MDCQCHTKMWGGSTQLCYSFLRGLWYIGNLQEGRTQNKSRKDSGVVKMFRNPVVPFAERWIYRYERFNSKKEYFNGYL